MQKSQINKNLHDLHKEIDFKENITPPDSKDHEQIKIELEQMKNEKKQEVKTVQPLKNNDQQNMQQPQQHPQPQMSQIQKHTLQVKQQLQDEKSGVGKRNKSQVVITKLSEKNENGQKSQVYKFSRIISKRQKSTVVSKNLVVGDEFHKLPLDILLKKLQLTSIEFGLTTEQATLKNQLLGDNKLPEKEKIPAWILFIKELLNWFAILLWISGGLCVFAYFMQPEQGLGNIYLALVLIVTVFITASITFMQNAKSEALMDSFKNMIPTVTYCTRDSIIKSTDPTKLVPGDVISINSGDKIPADCRIIQSVDMKVDNSALTGESEALLRTTECTSDNILETGNMAFFGTFCKEGSGKAIVIEIGKKTVLGQIADLATNSETPKTPLSQELDRFVFIITFIAIGLGIIFFFCARFAIGYTWVDSMIFGIGILVCNVPEGLLGCITISLAITAQKLAKKQVLVKNLEGVETLGSTSCICSDKTGTLTQNKMTVEHLWYDRKSVKGENRQKFGKEYKYEYDLEDQTFKELHRCAVTCSEATFETNAEDYDKVNWLNEKVKGDASETALVKFFQPIEDIQKTREKYPTYVNEATKLIAKMPFNSTHKFMLNIQQEVNEHSNYCIFLKGAPEKVWKFCSTVLVKGKNQPIDAAATKEFEKVNLDFAKNGERVLGFAKLHLSKQKHAIGCTFETSSPEKYNFDFKDCVFLGVISLQDPPKDSVPGAIKKCKSAGIKVVMVTGDQPPTAAAISKQVNIIPSNIKTNLDILEECEAQGKPITWQEAIQRADAIIIHGDQVTECLRKDNEQQMKEFQELQKQNPEAKEPVEIDTTLQSWVTKPYCVFARTTPIHKLKIVKACQKVGHICGVTGDGVNDSPAIKQGDIGISMGITGSDVTKDVADMILLNDDFASIVDGVEEGRKIFDNLKKTIVYLLTSNVAEIIPFSSQLIFLLPLPLNNMLMLIICVGTDILPALGLAYEAAELDIMTRKPRKKTDHLVTAKLMIHSYMQTGFIACAGGFFGYFTTLYWYGFTMNGLFGLQSNGLLTSLRGDQIPLSSYDLDSPYLGNPYLQNNYANNKMFGKNEELFTNCAYTLNILKNYEKDSSLKNKFKKEIQPVYFPKDIPDLVTNLSSKDEENTGMINYLGIDWQYQNDQQYDLRHIIVECPIAEADYEKYSDPKYNDSKETGWITKKGIFRECLHQGAESQFLNYFDMEKNSGKKIQLSVIQDKFINTDGQEVGIPICYNTEALKYAQTAYFVGIVIVQISNILSVKANKVSLLYTKWNPVIFYGIVLELVIAVILSYVPGVQEVFIARNLSIFQWSAGCIFSIGLLVWCEFRKYLIRRPTPHGGRNWFERNIHW